MDTITLFPLIKLKYWGRPLKNEKLDNDIVCFDCGTKGIHVGAGFQDEKRKPHFICEKCSIQHFKWEYDFRRLETARLRRRRMFDVPYLFHEMLIDRYLRERHKFFEDISENERDMLFSLYQQKYNELFSKKQKEKIEEMAQAEIEKKFMPFIKKIKFS